MTETPGRATVPRRFSPSASAAERFGDLVPAIAPRLARAVMIGVLTGYVTLACANMIVTGGGILDLALAVVCGGILLALQLGVVIRPREELSTRVRYAALLAEACVVFLPILKLSVSWAGLPGFLVGALFLLLRPAASIPLAAIIAGSMGWYTWTIFRETFEIPYTIVSTTVTGLVIFGLTRLYQLVEQVHAAQDTLAQLAVAEERARFSRDVHDLLGLSLSAIMLKTELVSKLVGEQPERARSELDEVMQITRKALAEARQVAVGYRELTLAEECDSAVSVLTTANVEVSLVREHRGFPRPVRSTLATVLRESVTNVLRHSEATWCTITLGSHDGTAELEVVNDGVPASRAGRAADSGSGSGLTNLTDRVRELGGTLTSAIEGDQHRLAVRIPLTSSAR